MSDNAQKTHFASVFNRAAEKKVADAIQVLGKSLPCHVVAVSGSIVTVRFDIKSSFTLPDVTCPEFGPEYIRYPTQVGDRGVVIPVDYYIGGVSGLGGGVANMSLRANLSTLIFYPIANVDWSATENPNALVLYGPDGAVLRTADRSSRIVVDKDDGILIESAVGVTIRAPRIDSEEP